MMRLANQSINADAATVAGRRYVVTCGILARHASLVPLWSFGCTLRMTERRPQYLTGHRGLLLNPRQ